MQGPGQFASIIFFLCLFSLFATGDVPVFRVAQNLQFLRRGSLTMGLYRRSNNGRYRYCRLASHRVKSSIRDSVATQSIQSISTVRYCFADLLGIDLLTCFRVFTPRQVTEPAFACEWPAFRHILPVTNAISSDTSGAKLCTMLHSFDADLLLLPSPVFDLLFLLANCIAVLAGA